MAKYEHLRTGVIIETDCDCGGKYWKKLEETPVFSSTTEVDVVEAEYEEITNESVIVPEKEAVKATKVAKSGAIINPKRGRKKE